MEIIGISLGIISSHLYVKVGDMKFSIIYMADQSHIPVNIKANLISTSREVLEQNGWTFVK